MVDETKANGEIIVTDDTSSSSTKSSSDTSRTSIGCVTCTPVSALEEEAVQAVKEASIAVKSIAISEMLPRTAELLFLNVTTLESHTYCVELCVKGYRIASARQDCMNGDFRQLGLHIRYFESIYELLDSISPCYREKFAESLASKLEAVANLQSQ